MLRKLTDCVTTLPFDFRHVTEFHGLCNNASFWFLACLRTSRTMHQRVPSTSCFLSIRLRNLTGHVITPFLAFRMLRKLTDCVTTLPFDFWHVTEFRGLRNNASFWFPTCLETSRIMQQRVPSTSKRSNKGCMPSNNGPRTKLWYDSCPSLLTFYRR